MLIVKVKICGVTNYEDAAAATDMGADLLGFNFYPGSPRFIEPEKAAEIIHKLPAYTDVVGVFVNSCIDDIREVIDMCSLNWVQLHGDETPQFCDDFLSLNIKTMKAIRVRDKTDITSADDFYTDALLFDAYDSELYGGTGKKFDWNIIGNMNKRVFLAGGITPENAADAISPGVYGIDVCSSIEAEAGRKDHGKMELLFENIKHLRG